MDFRKELEILINKYSMENGSNTPDFILADYLTACLSAFDKALKERERWGSQNLDEINIELSNGELEDDELPDTINF